MSKAGFSEREVQQGMEKVAVLAGDRKNAGQERAVRLKELRGRILEVIDAYQTRRVEERFPNGRRLAAFKDASLDAGLYNWRAGQSTDPPPVGYGGGALLLKRRDGNGAWLTTDNTGGQGQGRNRLFTRSTTGIPNDWLRWSEILLRDDILGTVLTDAAGVAQGGLFEAIEDEANGTAFKTAGGFQFCYATGRTVAFNTAASLIEEWTYPSPFSATPFAIVVAPTTGSGTYTGVSPSDLGAALSTPGTSSAFLGFRVAAGAPEFNAGDEVVGCSYFAFGRSA